MQESKRPPDSAGAAVPPNESPFYKAATWSDVQRLVSSKADARLLLAYQLQRAQDEHQLAANAAAALLDISPGTFSRNRNPRGTAAPSRVTAWLADRRMPISGAEFSFESLRDLYAMFEDREPSSGEGVDKQKLGAEEYRKAHHVEVDLIDLFTLATTRSTFCMPSGVLSSIEPTTEPVAPSDRVSYAFFTVSDPIGARVVVHDFFAGGGAIDGVNLLSIDHLMGRWDICVKYTIRRSIDPQYVFDSLVEDLKVGNMFPHPTQGYQRSAAEERVQRLNPEQAEFAKLVTSEKRAPLLPRYDVASGSQPVELRIPANADYASARVTRVFFFIDFHFVPDDHGARDELFAGLYAITVDTFGLHHHSRVEATAIGRSSAVLEIAIGCGGMPILSQFNRKFEESINRRWTVQKYNMFSYEHFNLWLPEARTLQP